MIGCFVLGLILGVIYGLMLVEFVNCGISYIDLGNLMVLVILGGMVV